MVSAKRTVTICSRGRATSRLTQAPHSRAQTVSRTPPSRSASGRLKDCNWRTSAIDSLLGCGRSEGCFEALQEARDPHQHHAEHGGDEGTLQVLGESDPADRVRLAVVIGKIGELREQESHVPARKEQERKQRSEEHTSELQSLMRISYAVLCSKTK